MSSPTHTDEPPAPAETSAERPAPSEQPARGRPRKVVFASFFERDALRERRRRSRRNTLILSLAIHGLALLGLVVYSLWQVDELWGRAVQVKVYSPSKAPRQAVEMTLPNPPPAAPPLVPGRP